MNYTNTKTATGKPFATEPTEIVYYNSKNRKRNGTETTLPSPSPTFPQKVVIEVYFRHAWRDPRLVVPEHLFNNTDVIPLSYGFLEDVDLWLPDPYIEKVQ